MSRFFIGQRVRIVNVPTPRNGREARIVGRSFSNSTAFGPGEYWDCDVSGIGPRNPETGIKFAYPDENLEPILPEGHQPSEFTTLHDLLASLEVTA